MTLLSNATFDNYPRSLNPSVPDASDVVYFTPYERKGVIVMAVAGVLSCALVSILLLYILFTVFVAWNKRNPDSPTPFAKKQVAVFVVCLLMSDLIQSISGIIQVKWAAENRIFEGGACTAQAATLVMGDLGSTIWSCVIAAHTFSALAIGRYWTRSALVAVVSIGWIFITILTIIGPTTLEVPEKGPFYGIAGDWCFITSSYAIPRLGIHYIPLFVAAIVIFVFYGLVFLVLRGKISFSSHGVHLTSMRFDDVLLKDRISVAKRMLWYPIAYLTCILPIAILRLVGLNQETIPNGVWIFGMFFLFLLGAIDSVIYASTRIFVTRGPFKVTSQKRGFSLGFHSATTAYKSEWSDVERAHTHNALKMGVYGPSEEELARKMDRELDLPRSEHEMRPYAGSIRVTLEQIQEVI